MNKYTRRPEIDKRATRAGAIVVKLDEQTDIEVAIAAIRMGKKTVTRNGRKVRADHTKADAVVALVKQALAAKRSDSGSEPAVG